MYAIVEGKKVKKGDWVGFKMDIETNGEITGFRNGYLIVEYSDESGWGTEVTEVHPRDCWIP